MLVGGMPLGRRAGDAVAWKTAELGGLKAIFLVRMLILASMLAPQDFGLLAVATVAIGVMMSVTELGMTPALVHQPDVNEDHYDSAWTANMARALCVSSVVFGAAPFIASVFNEPRAADILRVLALRPLIDSTASVKVAALMRNLEYRSLALVRVPGAVADTLVSVALASTLGVWALVIGTLAGALAGTVSSYVLAPHRPRLRLSSRAVRPLMRYGRWVFLTRVVSVAATSLTQVVIARRLGVLDLGLYFLATKLAFLPHEVASQVVGDVAFSLFARVQQDRERVARAFRSVVVGMSALLIPVHLFLICLAPSLVAHVFGERWLGTEHLIQLLALVGVVGLFGDVAVPVFRGVGYPNWILWLELWQSSLVLVLLWSLIGRYGAPGAALAWVIAIGSAQLLSLVLIRRLLPRPLTGLGMPLAGILLASIAGAGTAIVAVHVMPGITGLLIGVPAGSGMTVSLLWFFDSRSGWTLRADLRDAFPRVAEVIGIAPGSQQ